MQTYLEALEASKTHAHRGIRWTPCDGAGFACSGRLEIVQGRRGQDAAEYLLTEFYPDAGFGAGRAVTLAKADGSEVYSVFAAADGRSHECDCAGFAYGRGKPCKHVEAVVALVANGWLPHPCDRAEQDVGATEVEDQPMPECFRTGFGTGAGCPFQTPSPLPRASRSGRCGPAGD